MLTIASVGFWVLLLYCAIGLLVSYAICLSDPYYVAGSDLYAESCIAAFWPVVVGALLLILVAVAMLAVCSGVVFLCPRLRNER